jgi:hypothetical protein
MCDCVTTWRNNSAIFFEEKDGGIGGHRYRRKQRLHRFRFLPNTKLKRLHCSRYLPHKKLKRLYRSRDLHKKIIETIKSFFLLQFLLKVTVNRSRYGIELKNRTVKSIPLLCLIWLK